LVGLAAVLDGVSRDGQPDLLNRPPGIVGQSQKNRRPVGNLKRCFLAGDNHVFPKT